MDLTYEQLGGSDEIKRFDSIVSVERVITRFTAVHGQQRPYPSSARLVNVSGCVYRVMTLTVIRNFKELRILTKSLNSGEVIPMPFKVVEFEWQKQTECQVECQLPVLFVFIIFRFSPPGYPFTSTLQVQSLHPVGRVRFKIIYPENYPFDAPHVREMFLFTEGDFLFCLFP